jgi:hypothetical protein
MTTKICAGVRTLIASTHNRWLGTLAATEVRSVRPGRDYVRSVDDTRAIGRIESYYLKWRALSACGNTLCGLPSPLAWGLLDFG